MLDEKDLQAIAALMNQQRQGIMDDVGQLMDKKLEPITARLDKLEAKADTMKQELKAEISHEIRALIEVDVVKDLKTLAAGHALLVEQMAKRNEVDEAKEVIHTLLDVLRFVVRQHSDEIAKLKKAQ